MDGEEGLTAEDKRESELLVEALACVLTHLSEAQISSDYDPQKEISRFHAVRAPSISLKEYLVRIARFFQCSPSCFVLALVYIDRALKLNASFLVDALSVHRLVLAAVAVAAKFFDDCYYSNAFYAKVGGIKVPELNALEVAFLDLIDWRLHVTAGDFRHYRNHVLLAVAGRTPSTVPGSPPFMPEDTNAFEVGAFGRGQETSPHDDFDEGTTRMRAPSAILVDEEGD
jgi:hypothetical protein